MAVLLRLLLLLLPIVALLAFIRHRMKDDLSEEEQEQEIEKLRRTLTGLAASFALVAFSLYFLTDTGAPGTCYISPKTVDGKVVSGRYVAEDDPACIAERARKTPTTDSLYKDDNG